MADDDDEDDIAVRTGFEEFKQLPDDASHDEKMLHALNSIADAVCYLAKMKFEEEDRSSRRR